MLSTRPLLLFLNCPFIFFFFLFLSLFSFLNKYTHTAFLFFLCHQLILFSLVTTTTPSRQWTPTQSLLLYPQSCDGDLMLTGQARRTAQRSKRLTRQTRRPLPTR